MRSRCFTCMSQTDRNVNGRVSHLAWNPCLDLLALIVDDVDVVLQRHFWKKAWSYRASRPVVAICWHPSGHCLTVALQDGTMVLLDTESGNVLCCVPAVFDGGNVLPIGCITWTTALQHDMDVRSLDVVGDLPGIPEQADGGTTTGKAGNAAVGNQQPHEWYSRIINSMNGRGSGRQFDRAVLAVCYAKNRIVLYADGIFRFHHIKLSWQNDTQIEVSECRVSPDLKYLFVVFADSTGKSHFEVLELTGAFWNDGHNQPLLWSVSYSAAQLSLINSYITLIMSNIISAWEDLLLEIDDKFVDFAKEKSMLCGEDGKNSTVADDLLVLLCFGTVSPEMEQFLLHSLTEKGLKKIMSSMDVVYEKLLQLLVNNLDSAVTAATYHAHVQTKLLQTILPFGHKSLTDVDNVSNCAGSLALKVSQLATVIRQSRHELHSFFQWLLSALIRLQDTSGNHGSGLELPPLISLDSQTNVPNANGFPSVSSLVRFIKQTFSRRWTDDIGAGKRLFRLEKVGQYLQDASIDVEEPDGIVSVNWWNGLEQQPQVVAELQAAGLQSIAFTHNPTDSLVQTVNRCEMQCEVWLLGPCSSARLDCRYLSKPNMVVLCAPVETDPGNQENECEPPALLRVTRVHLTTNKVVSRLVYPVLDENDQLVIDNVRVYNEDTIVALVSSRERQFLCKVQIDNETDLDNKSGRLTLSIRDDSLAGELSSMHVSLGGSGHGYGQLVVCSARRVGALVTNCRSKIRLLDMEPDEESTTLSASNME